MPYPTKRELVTLFYNRAQQDGWTGVTKTKLRQKSPRTLRSAWRSCYRHIGRQREILRQWFPEETQMVPLQHQRRQSQTDASPLTAELGVSAIPISRLT